MIDFSPYVSLVSARKLADFAVVFKVSFLAYTGLDERKPRKVKEGKITRDLSSIHIGIKNLRCAINYLECT